ncbi:MAG: hypothetical protein M3P83_10040 [Actinomycetota bacterium]|nr:hypothetical protein [Actinomycetota bacterium]
MTEPLGTESVAAELSAATPPARRLQPARWRDPRLWIGLLLVAGSVVVGARLLAAADDTVGVWATPRDVADGAGLSPDALVVEQVRFADAGAAARYLLASEGLPAEAVAGRNLAAGELIPRTAVTTRGSAPAVELPVLVGASGAPEDLQPGEVVDVWVVPEAPAGEPAAAADLVLPRARVVGAARDSGPLGDAPTRQVLLGLGAEAAPRLPTVLAQLTSGTVVLIRQQG